MATPCSNIEFQEFGGDSDGVDVEDVVEALLFPPPNRWRAVVTIPKDMVVDVIRVSTFFDLLLPRDPHDALGYETLS